MEDLYKYLKDTQTINPNVGLALAIEGASDDTEDATAVAADIREGKTAYIATGKVTGTFKGIDTSDATATEADLLSGKIAYVNGNKITGTIASKEAQTYVPSASEQVINSGQYLAGAQTIIAVPTEEKSITPSSSTQEVAPTAGKFLNKVTVSGDANLVADNIKNGVSIFGVQGTLTSLDTSDANATAADILTGKTAYVNGSKVTGSIPSVEAATITPGTLNQTINAGQYVAGAQTIKGEPNLLAENIKNGVSIFGVSGTYNPSTGIDTSDATAAANQILEGATAYVNGEKITGTVASLTNTGWTSIGISNPEDITFNESHLTLSSTFEEAKMIQAGDQVMYMAQLYRIAEKMGITSEQIAVGNTVMSIEGTYTSDGTALAGNIDSGVIAYSQGQRLVGTSTKKDTSDATATAEDIASGVTAYANGEKITGTVTVIDNNIDTELYNNVRTTYGNGIAATISGNSLLLRTGSTVVINGDEVIAAIGLTADKIKAGETILGIEGTYTGE